MTMTTHGVCRRLFPSCDYDNQRFYAGGKGQEEQRKGSVVSNKSNFCSVHICIYNFLSCVVIVILV